MTTLIERLATDPIALSRLVLIYGVGMTVGIIAAVALLVVA
jgi:hypothetical protein